MTNVNQNQSIINFNNSLKDEGDEWGNFVEVNAVQQQNITSFNNNNNNSNKTRKISINNEPDILQNDSNDDSKSFFLNLEFLLDNIFQNYSGNAIIQRSLTIKYHLMIFFLIKYKNFYLLIIIRILNFFQLVTMKLGKNYKLLQR